MAADFDDFPVYTTAIDIDAGTFTPVWTEYLATFFQSLIGYLSSQGIFLPQLTTAQRDLIQSPVNGQMIYNTDAAVQAPQIWQNGAWKTFTTF